MNKACIACKFSAICLCHSDVDIALGRANGLTVPHACEVPDDCPVLGQYKEIHKTMESVEQCTVGWEVDP